MLRRCVTLWCAAAPPAPSAQSARPAAAAERKAPVRRLGRVVAWEKGRPFGFLLDLNTNEELMAHFTEIEGASNTRLGLQVHQVVEYDEENGKATRITAPGGGQVRCLRRHEQGNAAGHRRY
eukprot:TRINITY_DN29727_c0_g1_i1.p1 TRINITY_DN29727_c0_g1~~TRINITY_DN29727_c0_g1_i1.p1  ORF type:complete len:122 (+),score=28.06 TRINITY_DN29727_c0_g1_i1:72-437(+)